MRANSNQKLIIIISSPSGAGKTTVTRELLKKLKSSYLSVSCTTREPRIGEKNKKDYFFVSKSHFLHLKRKNAFLETAKVFGNYYGTLKSQLKNKNKKILLLDVDWQGARSIRKKIKKNCHSFFLLPPSIKELKKRLMTRHKDNKSIAIKRISYARKDIKYWTEYDYVFVNKKLTFCVKEIIDQINNLIKNNLKNKKINKLIKKF